MMRRRLAQMAMSIFVPIAMCAGCKEITDRHFANLEVARQNHMIEKGWIPDVLPTDARDIDVWGDLDAARVYGTYTSSDTATLRQHCSETDDSFRVLGYGPDWFRQTLKETDTAGGLRRKGYDVLKCQQGDFYIVALSARQFGYFWSVRN